MGFFSRLWRWILKFIAAFFLLTIGWTLLAGFLPVYFTPLMVIRSVEAIREGKPVRNEKQWVKLDDFSPHLVQAVVASEDNLFMEHKGFSIEDIRKALEHNKSGKRIRGASTISQQTAKNVFLWNKRSWVRKGLEAYFTVLIELLWSKQRIMEVYLNVIEMGDGIYGAQAAAQNYFGRDALRLNREQSALIAVCLPNPRKFNPARPSPYIQRRQRQILSLMNKIAPVNFEKPQKDKKSKR